MKEITKTCTIYQAFDGTEFTNFNDCNTYEQTKVKENMVNLKNFEIAFPMQDACSSCRAYKINSENEFEMFKSFIISEYCDVYDDCFFYEGNGWYVLQGYGHGSADVYKLSCVMKNWADTLNTIIENTMDF